MTEQEIALGHAITLVTSGRLTTTDIGVDTVIVAAEKFQQFLTRKVSPKPAEKPADPPKPPDQPPSF